MPPAKDKPAESPDDVVVIKHPKQKSAGVCTRHQFDEVWKDAGFKIQEGADPDEIVPPNPDAGTTADAT